MKTISGSLLILAAAVIYQPAVENPGSADEAMVFAVPLLVVGIALIVFGLKTKS